MKRFNPDVYHTTYYDKSQLNCPKKMVITVYDLIHELFSHEYGFPKIIYQKNYFKTSISYNLYLKIQKKT